MARSARPRRVVLVSDSVRELFDALGGVATVAATFAVSQQAVFNWCSANAVPARHHALMLMVTERAGLYWRPPGWDPAVQLRYKPVPEPEENTERAA